MGPALTHIALHVADPDACIDFYRRYCGLMVSHERTDGSKRIVWLAEPGRESEFVIVVMPGGKQHSQAPGDYSHLGFAVESRKRVDELCQRARTEGCLAWEPVDEPYPVGYYCGVRDPNGNILEFSFGQPLGPGSPGLGSG
ncbi:MAG: VOC family protein [Spirochaetales bacterium]|nr:VOC family protein [Leptospiraceae bacterium]MCP5482949.1 VOC family protein [Spirochaetales bacterium]MCP5484870.1 VOC family protein [Spirochaetales bacterium]